MSGDELPVIFVRSDHIDIHLVRGEALRDSAYHVIGLEPADHQHRNVHGADNRGERFQSIDDKLRSLGAVGLVFRVEFVAESAARRVETHRQMGRLLALHQFKQIFGETEKYGGVHALGVDHGTPEERIVHLEDERMPIDKKKFHCTKMKLFPKLGNSPLTAFYLRILGFTMDISYLRPCHIIETQHIELI